MDMRKSLILWLVVSLATGCASMSDTVDPMATIEPSKGVLLAGVTSDGNDQVMDAWFYFRKKGENQELRLDAFGMAGLFKKPNDFEGRDSHKGRLIALPVDPGEYELFNWTLYVSRLGGYGYISPKTPPPPHSFTIKAGEITYIGGLHIDTISGKNSFGISLAFGGNPDITDQTSRDVSVLKTKYSNLINWPIQTSVPDGRQWKISR